MPRSGAEARNRLEQAALALYAERGYDRTTTAEIAARAGVTERTYFRHFADKREVLFNIEGSQQQRLARALADVPKTVAPLEAVLRAFRSMVPVFESNRSVAEARYRVIAATPALREREMMKEAAISDVVADALRGRGIADSRAVLLARISTATLSHVIHTWVADSSADMDRLLLRAFDDLKDFAREGADEVPPTHEESSIRIFDSRRRHITTSVRGSGTSTPEK